MAKKENKKLEPARPYIPSAAMREKLNTNRQGKLTVAQRTPILTAALFSGIGLLCPLSFFASNIIGLITGATPAALVGVLGWLLLCGMVASLFFLAAVLWVNAAMFVPEAFSKLPVRWERGMLELRLASRERPEMPFSYIIGTYSFAPFVAPAEVPMQIGREYIVYYTARSRLLLSIAPTDQPESVDWLPES